LRTIFLAHAEPDHEFACRLAEFLEFGCDITCYTDAGLMSSGQDLIDKAEEGLGSDILVLILSEASCPARWPRERWEPVLFEETRLLNVDLVSILRTDCPFPALLRRKLFFEATANRLPAFRLLKRWIWHRERGATISGDLEKLYERLSDRAGSIQAPGAVAERFASEAAHEFEAVLWVPCHGRSLAQAAGDLGAQLGLRLEGTAKKNCAAIRDFLSARRCLLVLDAPRPEIAAALEITGRTSVLRTADPVRTADSPSTLAYARALVAAGRYAEAYELLYALLDAWVDTETCARELAWICEHWDRVPEANALRMQYGTGPPEQLALF
jgi:hypothetical protein